MGPAERDVWAVFNTLRVLGLVVDKSAVRSFADNALRHLHAFRHSEQLRAAGDQFSRVRFAGLGGVIESWNRQAVDV